MKTMILSITSALVLSLVGIISFAKSEACKFADMGKLKEHLEKHITYPTTGKAIKAACKKSMD